MVTKAQLKKAWQSGDEKLYRAAAEVMINGLAQGNKPDFTFDDLGKEQRVCFMNVFMEKINHFSPEAFDVAIRLRDSCPWSEEMIVLLVKFSSDVMFSAYSPENYEPARELLWKGKVLHESDDQITLLTELLKSSSKNPRMLPVLSKYVREFRIIPVPSIADVYIGLWKEMFEKLTPEYWEKAFDILFLLAVHTHRFKTTKALSVLMELRHRYGHYREWTPRFEEAILKVIRTRKKVNEIEVWEVDKICHCCTYTKSFGLKVLSEVFLAADDDGAKKSVWHNFENLRGGDVENGDYHRWFTVPTDGLSEDVYSLLKCFAEEGGYFLNKVQEEIFYSIMGAVGTARDKKYGLKKIVNLSLKNCKGNLYSWMALANLMQAFAWHGIYDEKEFLSKVKPLIKMSRLSPDPMNVRMVLEMIATIYKETIPEKAVILLPVIEQFLKNALQNQVVTEEHEKLAKELYQLTSKPFDFDLLVEETKSSIRKQKENNEKLLRVLKKELQ